MQPVKLFRTTRLGRVLVTFSQRTTVWRAGLLDTCWGPRDDPARRVLDDEAHRIATIEKVKPSVAAVFAPGGQGGGSGVLISKDGYALTNFHVVQAAGPVMQCGLPDGVLYDAVLVGTRQGRRRGPHQAAAQEGGQASSRSP